MIHFQSLSYDYTIYDQLLRETIDRDVIIIIIITLSELGRKRTKAVKPLFVNKTSLKPASHDQPARTTDPASCSHSTVIESSSQL